MDLSSPATQAMIGSVIRSILIAVGGGTLMSNDQETAMAGALAVIAGVIWSIIQKRRASEDQHAAVVEAVSRVSADPASAREVIAQSQAGKL